MHTGVQRNGFEMKLSKTRVKQEIKLHQNISKTQTPELKASCTTCKKLEKIFLHSVDGTWYNIVRYYTSADLPSD